MYKTNPRTCLLKIFSWFRNLLPPVAHTHQRKHGPASCAGPDHAEQQASSSAGHRGLDGLGFCHLGFCRDTSIVSGNCSELTTARLYKMTWWLHTLEEPSSTYSYLTQEIPVRHMSAPFRALEEPDSLGQEWHQVVSSRVLRHQYPSGSTHTVLL